MNNPNNPNNPNVIKNHNNPNQPMPNSNSKNRTERLNDLLNKYQAPKENENPVKIHDEIQLPKNKVRKAVGSSGLEQLSDSPHVFGNLGAKIKNLNGYDILKFEIAPGASLVTNQDTMAYMDGGLTMNATVGKSFFNAILRGISGSSVLQNTVENKTHRSLTIAISPLLQGSIIQVNIKAGESWRFADRSFLACTPNLVVTGNLNIFSNFRMVFVGQNVSFVQINAPETDGIVWISAHGAAEVHSIEFGTGNANPFYINNGCFLGMVAQKNGIDYFKDYVRVGLASTMFTSFFTDIGFVMKIQDSIPPRRSHPTHFTVLTQSLNPHNLEKYISRIVEQHMDRHRGGSYRTNELPNESVSDHESAKSFIQNLRFRKTLRNK